MIYERRQAMAEALSGISELNGNVHPFPPDALAPPVGYVERVVINRESPTMRSLSATAEVVLVADGHSTEARKLLDAAGTKAWLALNRNGCTAQSMDDVFVGDGPTYPALRIVVSTATACT